MDHSFAPFTCLGQAAVCIVSKSICPQSDIQSANLTQLLHLPLTSVVCKSLQGLKQPFRETTIKCILLHLITGGLFHKSSLKCRKGKSIKHFQSQRLQSLLGFALPQALRLFEQWHLLVQEVNSHLR